MARARPTARLCAWLAVLLHQPSLLLVAADDCLAWCNQWTCTLPDCIGCGAELKCPAKPPPPPAAPPKPSIPPFDYRRRSPGAIQFAGVGGVLYGNEKPFHIKGVNWVGSEGRAGPPLGLDKHDIAWYMQWLKDNGFNAIRLLFNHQYMLSNEPLEPPNEAVYGVGAPWESPELAHYRYLDMFAKITDVAAEHGILIMMAAHRLTPTAWPGNGLWYSEEVSEARVLESWDLIMQKMCGKWNFFAVDLQNEPHASSWAKRGGTAADWGHAAERLGNHVLQQCARLLIFVEGVGYAPGSPGMDNGGDGIWWGENLAGVKTQPVELIDPSKLVYSPHTYGPSVYAQTYFKAHDFPNNMPAIWRARFDFVRQLTGAPVVIGEMGGFYTETDKRWQDWAATYMKTNGIGVFYFALGPESDDTGGLLKKDYTTPETAKLEMLAHLPCTDAMALHTDTLAKEALATSPQPPPLPKPPPAPKSPMPPPRPPNPPPPSPSPRPPPSPPSPSPRPSVPTSQSFVAMAIYRSHHVSPPPPRKHDVSVAHLVARPPPPPPEPEPELGDGVDDVERTPAAAAAKREDALSKFEQVVASIVQALGLQSGAGGQGKYADVTAVAVVALGAGFATVLLCVCCACLAWCLCFGGRRGRRGRDSRRGKARRLRQAEQYEDEDGEGDEDEDGDVPTTTSF